MMLACDQARDRLVTKPLPFGQAAADAIHIVTHRLEQAGRAMLAMPQTGYTTGMKTGGLDFVRAVVEAYGWENEPIRPSAPTSRAITDMDEAYGWLALIPDSRQVVRRIVGARSLIHPITDRHLYPWRRLASALNEHHIQVQRWHAEGIRDIVAQLHRAGFFN